MADDRAEAEAAAVVNRMERHLEETTERMLKWPTRDDVRRPVEEYAREMLEQLRSRETDTEPVLDEFDSFLQKLARQGTDPLYDLYQAVLTGVIKAYQHYGVTPSVVALPSSVCFLADWSNVAPPSSFRSSFRAAATTENGCEKPGCCSSQRQHAQTLAVSLAPASFDAPTLAALPFALFHECTSHVLQGPCPWTSARATPDADSQFAEGWMDRAAWEIFEMALAQQGPCSNVDLFPYPHRRDFYKTGGGAFYDARHDVKAAEEGGEPAAGRRQQGWETFGIVLQELQKRHIHDALPSLLQLSFALNVSDVSPELRDSAVQTLHTVLRQGKRSEPEAGYLMAALVRYAKDRQLSAFLATAERVSLALRKKRRDLIAM
ncbi:hypothetical protein ACIQWL_26860 [Streptomyces mirabilis]|uniref:hypothetical protein n=1 Tax=Streptomyces mirabilis TaxID=68239 RepID=UPI0037FEBE1E